jgi:hypothetical protein
MLRRKRGYIQTTRPRGILTTARSGTVNDVRGQMEDKRGHELSGPMGQWGRFAILKDAEVQSKVAMLVQMACVMGREWRA